jgi:ribosome-binding factor A
MDSTRRARLAQLIQEELSVFINRQLKDPRVPSITLTRVDLTPDAGLATIYITLLGVVADDSEAYQKQIKDCLEGLSSASGFLRRHVGKVVTLRSIPSLVFKEDRGLMNTLRVTELLKQISQEKHEPTPSNDTIDEQSEKKNTHTP